MRIFNMIVIKISIDWLTVTLNMIITEVGQAMLLTRIMGRGAQCGLYCCVREHKLDMGPDEITRKKHE